MNGVEVFEAMAFHPGRNKPGRINRVNYFWRFHVGQNRRAWDRSRRAAPSFPVRPCAITAQMMAELFRLDQGLAP